MHAALDEPCKGFAYRGFQGNSPLIHFFRHNTDLTSYQVTILEPV